jgi:hypothetical protein
MPCPDNCSEIAVNPDWGAIFTLYTLPSFTLVRTGTTGHKNIRP